MTVEQELKNLNAEADRIASSRKPTEVKISNDLIEAYKGYYEDQSYPNCNKRFIGEPTDEQAKEMILADTPKERLEVYCTWNGIIGYAGRLYSIATGEL